MAPSRIQRSVRGASGCSEVVQAVGPPSPAVAAALSLSTCRAAPLLPATADSAGLGIRSGWLPRFQEPKEARGMERERGLTWSTTR
jgi:hypothetical protein